MIRKKSSNRNGKVYNMGILNRSQNVKLENDAKSTIRNNANTN